MRLFLLASSLSATTHSKCEKSFYSSSSLKVHMTYHSAERPFQCEYCDKAFKTSKDLKVHKMIHTGEKPFKCDQCDYACNQFGNLKKHQFNKHKNVNEKARGIS